MEEPIECKDNSDNLNINYSYRVATDSGIITYPYRIEGKAKLLADIAENHFAAGNSDSALIYYKLLLEEDPKLYFAMTYIGQVYGQKGDYDNAILWYKKAIRNNYIDYMAHWFLADTYVLTNNLDEAVEEIAIAQILNRNNPRIKKALISIFEKDKRNIEDWCFNPQITLNKVSDTKISVAASGEWTGYAIGKAIWEYEPGYKESMGVQPGQYSTDEDKECLVSVLVTMENVKNDPPKNLKYDFTGAQFTILNEAVHNKHINEYIFFEIVLPRTPQVAYQLPEASINSMKDYLLTIRHKKL
ncbi:MAG: hypothetical protein IPM69_16225 [Ignavibacteria bacterium]|nr:hypothetical protein [Ignavibacteria bacterium]